MTDGVTYTIYKRFKDGMVIDHFVGEDGSEIFFAVYNINGRNVPPVQLDCENLESSWDVYITKMAELEQQVKDAQSGIKIAKTMPRLVKP